MEEIRRKEVAVWGLREGNAKGIFCSAKLEWQSRSETAPLVTKIQFFVNANFHDGIQAGPFS